MGNSQALVSAAGKGQTEVVRKMLEQFPEMVDQTSKLTGQTGLRAAIQKGHKETVQLLLDAGANTELQNEDGETALLYSARRNQQEIMEVLIQHKCEINAQGSDGYTALHWATDKGHKEMVQLLLGAGANMELQNKNGNTAVNLSAMRNQQGIMELLIQHKCKLNTQDNNGFTALHCAIDKGNKEIVPLLLGAGANMELQSKKGNTALNLSARTNQQGIMELLIQHKCKLNTQDNNGLTALHWAIDKGHKEIVQLLLGAGANMELQTKKGNTALNLSARTNQQGIMELLIQHKCKLNTQDNNGLTALHWAIDKGHKEIVQLLLGAGANMELQTKKGNTALHLAAFWNRQEIMEVLIQHRWKLNTQGKADVEIRNNNNETPLSLAQSQSHTSIIELLTSKVPIQVWPNLDTSLLDVNVKKCNADDSAMNERFENAEEVYSMKGMATGVRVLIINNKKFYGRAKDTDKPISERPGTDIDAMSLNLLFTKLGYKFVKTQTDLTGQGIISALKEEAQNCRTTDNAFICVILSHGTIGSVYGVDGQPVKLRDICNQFNGQKCPNLVGRPKVFFIQACQGDKQVEETDSVEGLNKELEGLSIEKEQAEQAEQADSAGDAPPMSDILVSTATTEGYVSWRNIEKGSWFIQALVYVIQNYAYKYDLLQILTKTNALIGTQATMAAGHKQSAEKRDTFRKQFYFFPGFEDR